MNVGGFFKGFGKLIAKGTAALVRHPEVLQGILEGAQQVKAARDAKKAEK